MERKEPQGSEEPVLNIAGERVALGPLRADLLPLYGRWINDFGTIRMLGLPPAPVTAEKERNWYEGRARAENDLMFTIYERETLQHHEAKGRIRPIVSYVERYREGQECHAPEGAHEGRMFAGF